MPAVDSRHMESRSLTTGNFNIRFFLLHSLLFVCLCFFFQSVKRQDKTKIYDLEMQLRLRNSDL